MASAESAGVDAQTAANIITAAVQTAWDREFISKDKIKIWLSEQVQRVPFDPSKIKLLDYVKSRMAAAESQQKQQQQQQQQQQAQQQRAQSLPTTAAASSRQTQLAPTPAVSANATSANANSTTQTKPAVATNGNGRASTSQSSKIEQSASSYTVISDEDSSGQESDDGQYQFGFEDMVDPDAGRATGLLASRSPSPLPPPLSQSIGNRPHSTAATANPSQIFPFAGMNGQSNRPFSTALPVTVHAPSGALPFTNPTSSSVSMGLNPALLLNNPSGTISPHQLGSASSSAPPLQVNGLSYASSPQQLPVASTSATGAPSNKAKRRQEFEVVVPQRRESSPASSAKRKRSTANDVAAGEARQPLSATTAASGQQKQKQQEKTDSTVSAPGTTSTHPASILSITKNTPKQPSPAMQKWLDNKKEILRSLQQANRTPHKTVTKLFRMLEDFVTEPEGATSRPGSREAFVTDLRVPTEARLAILDIIRDETNNDFDVIFVVDPRATVLLHEWTRDLAYIAKGKYDGEEDKDLVKTTARPLMEVLRKLPISIDVLRALKGVGQAVSVVSKSDVFEEEAKNIAGLLVRKWLALSQRVDGGSARASSATPAPQSGSAGNKRASLAPPASNAGEEDARKKRKVSPTPSALADSGSSTKLASSKSAASSKVAVTTGPKGTQPLGKLPTSNIKATTSTTSSGGKVLPSFAKRKPAASAISKPAVRPATAPSLPAPAAAPAFDPFAMSLQDMAASKESAAGSGMSVGDTLNMLHKAVDNASILNSSHAVPRAGPQKKKSVRWQEEDKLVLIKWVDKLVYGDEYGNEITTSEYFNTTGETAGENEGAAMKGLVEQMEWEEPEEVDVKLPEDMVAIKVGYPHPELMAGEICERDRQAEREKGVLAVTYFNDDEIPPCPGEDALLPDDKMRPTPAGEPITMLLSQALAGDQSVQLSILRAQTALVAGQQQQQQQLGNDASAPMSYPGMPTPTGYDSMPGGPAPSMSMSANPYAGLYSGQSSQMQQPLYPHQQPHPGSAAIGAPGFAAGAGAGGAGTAPALGGADLGALLAQLSGSGPLGGGFQGNAQPTPPYLGHHQHQQQHQQPQPHYQQPHMQYPQHYQQY